jgi:hypothetical protein
MKIRKRFHIVHCFIQCLILKWQKMIMALFNHTPVCLNLHFVHGNDDCTFGALWMLMVKKEVMEC